MKNRNGNLRRKQLIRFILAAMFLTAGIAHFIFQERFTGVIPKSLPLRPFINEIVGGLEIILALLYYSKIQKSAYIITFGLLLVYIWAHIYFIQIGSCTAGFCISPWISWVRLIVIHPILLYLNYYLIKND